MSEAYEAARDAYLAKHPEPETVWFRCARCKAGPGQPCQGRPGASGVHAPRLDLRNHAFRLRHLDAADSADNHLNEVEGDPRRYPTDRHLQYMRRVGARPITKED